MVDDKGEAASAFSPGDLDNPFIAIRDTLDAFPGDWSYDEHTAWIYGIVCGWGEELPEVASEHEWDQRGQDRLLRLRAEWLRRTGLNG